MQEQEFYNGYLLIQHFNGTATVAEEQALRAWLNHSPLHQALYDDLNNRQRLLEKVAFYDSIDSLRGWRRVLEAIGDVPLMHPAKPVVRGWWVAVAAVLLLLAAGWWLFIAPKSRVTELAHAKMPAKGAALFTDAGGKQVVLKNTRDSVLPVTKAGAAGLNTLTTGHGRIFHVRLADGTQVWLNAGTTLHYPVEFTGAERRVFVTGEAYFEVAPDAAKPFVVQVKDSAEIKVTGTRFTACGYAGEPGVTVTLLEGRVQLTGDAKALISRNSQHPVRQIVEIGEGQQGIWNADGIRVKKGDPEWAEEWRQGRFVFQDLDLQTLVYRLEHWYGVEITCDEGVLPADKSISGELRTDITVKQMHEMLEEATHLHFSVR